jgi:hypothetical protein
MTESGVRKQVTPADVLEFWLAAGRDRWFEKDDAFDSEVRERFQPIYEDAAAGRLSGWEESPSGALALVIALDQFPRNLFRGSPRAYATDPLARAVAGRALQRGFDQQAEMPARALFYLPSNIQNIPWTRNVLWRLCVRRGMPNRSNGQSCTRMSSGASAGFRTETRCLAESRQRMSIPSSTAAGSRGRRPRPACVWCRSVRLLAIRCRGGQLNNGQAFPCRGLVLEIAVSANGTDRRYGNARNGMRASG